MRKINRQKFIDLLRDTKGKMFTVTWIKKDGSERTANGRLGVKYHAGSHRPMPYTPGERGYIPIWEVKSGKTDPSKGYRMVNVNTVKEFHFAGEIYEVR